MLRSDPSTHNPPTKNGYYNKLSRQSALVQRVEDGNQLQDNADSQMSRLRPSKAAR